MSDNQRNSSNIVVNNQRNASNKVIDNQRKSGVNNINFSELVESHRNHLYGMLYNMVRNHQDTEDLLQETWLKAHKAIGNFRGDSSVGTWLHKIAYNTGLNHIRRYGDRYNISIDDSDNGLDHDIDYIERTTGDGVDKQCMGMELRDKLNDSISKLPVKHQLVVKYFDIDGYSHKEIGNKLGVNENTVRSRLFYAHKKLQVMMEDYKEVI